MITYKPLIKLLKDRGVSIYKLQEVIKNQHLRVTLNNGKYITLETLDTLCRILNCNVQDIIQYENGERVIKDIPAKVYVQVDWPKIKELCESKRTSLEWMSLRMKKSKTYLRTLSYRPHVSTTIAKNIANVFSVQLEEILSTKEL